MWIDYFRERDTTTEKLEVTAIGCGLITLGNEIQRKDIEKSPNFRCGLITLGNEIQHHKMAVYEADSCGLITLGNEIQP